MADVLKDFDYAGHGWHSRFRPRLSGVKVLWVTPKVSDVELARMDAEGGHWEPFYIAEGYADNVYPTQAAAVKAGIRALERVKRDADAALAKLRAAHEPEVSDTILVAVTMKN
jgi:hypothetical protein